MPSPSFSELLALVEQHALDPYWGKRLPEFSDQFILQLGPGALAECCTFFDIDARLDEDEILFAVFALRDALRVDSGASNPTGLL
jgi:hypothetical protein